MRSIACFLMYKIHCFEKMLNKLFPSTRHFEEKLQLHYVVLINIYRYGKTTTQIYETNYLQAQTFTEN